MTSTQSSDESLLHYDPELVKTLRLSINAQEGKAARLAQRPADQLNHQNLNASNNGDNDIVGDNVDA